MIWKTRYGTGAVFTYRNLIDPMIYPLRPRIVRLCSELGARKVLDIASGTGAQCRMLGAAGMQATGLDLAEAMIATAERLGGANTEFVLGSATELPFASSSFDACLLLLALHEHQEEDRIVMLAEARRVLRPSGHLVIAEFQEPARRQSLHVPWQLIRFIEHSAGDEHHAGFVDFVSRGCLSGILHRHGLEPVRELRSHFGTIRVAAATAR
ncbi:class I SAM-dependent methyltransferase [Candidatus Bipolaricaulota bacterium]|nr:class I SAM-dependent methyltransferase [Candidatus Bipolaricaulota bacterium]